ncbi:MAG: malonyl-CoA decarboxylase [Rhodospirillaceae bacterium]|jgi:malonyl-CoA decarboxylase|nr:malonyl-CoA decarboxylase [Rhodospirillaceae bacterium]
MSIVTTRRRWLNHFLETVAERGRELLDREPASNVVGAKALCRDLLSLRGEASGRAIAREILSLYRSLNEEAKFVFFGALRDEFAAETPAILSAAQAYAEDQNDSNLAALQYAVESPRQELFRRLNLAPNGTASIIDMRADLLQFMKQEPTLACVDRDLRHLLTSWFNVGFLELRGIDWETPAATLEKLIAYESVHEIRDWADLRRRLGSDRRCFAFFHPALPEEPLIFVEVALTNEITTNVHQILDAPTDSVPARNADTAIFYSINNCQVGLRGISFGNFLIKQVVVELQSELPNIRNFSTLSPIPGFTRWAAGEGKELAQTILGYDYDLLTSIPSAETVQRKDCPRQKLERLCAHYLMHAKRDGRAADPVCHFHISNGAQLGSVNYAADCSENGLRQSTGMMVNYVYRTETIEQNHESYATTGHVTADRNIEKLAQRD